MSEHPRRKYAARYPNLYDLLVAVLSNQYEKDWLESAVAEHVANCSDAELRSTLAELSRAAEDTEVVPEEVSQLTNYNLTSRDDMLGFLQDLGKRLVVARKN